MFDLCISFLLLVASCYVVSSPQLPDALLPQNPHHNDTRSHTQVDYRGPLLLGSVCVITYAFVKWLFEELAIHCLVPQIMQVRVVSRSSAKPKLVH